ncbi:ABC transporter permease [Microbacterium sp. SORGH_AS_0888]|uniref:ABC transporter permease n=1 Tax=Microbacterium sp. SORGH_AS_0888 TaxID=3041791 RepID=UPI00278313DD|nr:ABC transporter permease [Microbacterium sp. SORGH_AS_0888]MDQ1129226.1 ABC-type transport system involved in multi-copper enzyme maturation permease subunit [Microbacterium sp. SORGH_AS_0888]
MNPARMWTVVQLELAQRVRSVAWYVLLGVFAFVMLAVTLLAFMAWSWAPEPGGGIYSTIVYVVLLLVVLVSPTVAGNAVNGDREAATLAAVQVTLASTADIVFGKLIAAWITGLGFVVVAVPFMAVAVLAGGLAPAALAVSLLVLVIEIGVFAAIGVGMSALIGRPLFSIAATYLVVAAFVIGTLVAFGLLGASLRTEVTSHGRWSESAACGTGTSDVDCDGVPDGGSGGPLLYQCTAWQTTSYEVPRFDRVWWILAANPFVVLADATPTTYNEYGTPNDLFGQIAQGVRMAQIAPEAETWNDGCDQSSWQGSPSNEERVADTTPSWSVGLGLQLVVAALFVWGAWARTRTPAKTLPPGTRVA